jgi:hypothetical protein
MSGPPLIQGLWIGPRLSSLERLSIVSFLRQGHPYHLYTYGEVAGLPEGAVLRDAGEILPASAIFLYPGYESYSGFANGFRYKLLLERGGWWADTDFVCLRPFDLDDEHVFARERAGSREVISNSVLRAPAGSELLAEAWRVCQSKDPARLEWGETGARLLGDLVQGFALERFVRPCEAFCPIGYQRWREVLDPAAAPEIGGGAYAVHLWREMWRRAGVDKDARFAAGCLYERLKALYQVR